MAIKSVGALLLCAGLGTRLRPATLQRAKPAIPFWGLPMALYSLHHLRQTPVTDVTVNLHHLPDSIRTLCLANELSKFRFSFSHEVEKPMGSGGALFYAKNYLQKYSAFFALNSDEVLIPSSQSILEKLRDHHSHTGALATLLVTDHPDLMKTLRPVWINPEGVVRGFGEKPASSETLRPVHYVGYKIFSSDVLNLIPEGDTHIFHDVLVPAMKRGALVNTLFDACDWWETGSFSGLLRATHDVTKLIHLSPNKNYIRSVYESFQKDFSFHTHCSNQGHWAIHKTSQVNLSSLAGTVFVDSQTQILPNARLQNCLIDKHLTVSSSLNEQFLLNDRGSL